MLILSMSNAVHDNSVVVADDYRILSAIQLERVTRIKGDGTRNSPSAGIMPEIIADALRAAGASASDIEHVAVSRGRLPSEYFYLPLRKRAWDSARGVFGKVKTYPVDRQMFKRQTLNFGDIVRRGDFLRAQGLRENLPLSDYNHHYAHAVGALFFTDWDNALLYTADGGGDYAYYSARHCAGGIIKTLFGGDGDILRGLPPEEHSVGAVYGKMTEALGYKINRHEGKLTGLAAFGEPAIYEELKKRFWVDDSGVVRTDLADGKERDDYVRVLGQSVKPADAAASVQKFLEEIVLESVGCYLKQTGARKLALAGGVFANVALNRRLAELADVDELFVFPAMGDEGLAVGGVYDVLLRRDGWEKWSQQRRRLEHLYWGGSHDDEARQLFNEQAAREGGDAAQTAAELLAAGKIVAIYCGGMEFGPRALGARSILANPSDTAVNKTLNERLQRTEFMPFAPYILEEDADDVFDLPAASKYAARFMTITCAVREKWRGRIPAVVHVDGSARPQIIGDKHNPLYARVLREFKARTGLPVLVNTSFNVHEEPIVYKPAECLRALNDGRVDYVLLPGGVYRRK